MTTKTQTIEEKIEAMSAVPTVDTGLEDRNLKNVKGMMERLQDEAIRKAGAIKHHFETGSHDRARDLAEESVQLAKDLEALRSMEVYLENAKYRKREQAANR